MDRRGMGRIAALAALTACVAAGLAPPASGAVRVGPGRVIVTTENASATVERSPLRITFADTRGRVRLAQVENSRPGPLLVPPLPEPEPLGGDSLDGPTLYAPLAFKVGDSASAQYPATAWVGNQLAGVEAGTMYSALDVTAARREGRSAVLEVSTSDASRRLEVRLAPQGADAIRVSARVTPGDGVYALGDSFATSAGEAFHGFGGRHNSLDQRGEDFYNWVEQQNVGAGPLDPVGGSIPGGGGETYQFPNGPTAAYYPQSQFISSRGYGFLLDREELSGWRMASDREDAWQVAAGAPVLDYVVAPGAPRRAIDAVTEITGRHRVPPEWGLGPQLDRLVRFTGHDPESYLADVRDDLEQLERHRVPITAYRIEAWEWLEKPTLREVIRELHRRRIKALVYFRAFVGQDDIGTDRPEYFDEAVENGYVAMTPSGDPYIYLSNFNAPTAQIDFTDPAALRWWKGRILGALRAGADGFMQDFGEQVQADMVFEDGSTGITTHNRFPVLFHRATRRVIKGYERRHPQRRIWFFTRSGYSGTPGSAAYEGGNFAGDVTTDWSRSSGLASVTTDMLNRAVGGAFGYSSDIGGYFDFHTPATPKELFVRWAEWAALSPLMRLHGSVNAGTHTPWSYDEQTVRIYRRLSRLHIAARPLILRLWRRAQETGIPPTRPLWLAFPGDREAAKQDQQWMLGPNILVAPIVEEGASERRVYFPRGCWSEHGEGPRHHGLGYETVEAPLGRLPWFVRCGTRPLERGRGGRVRRSR